MPLRNEFNLMRSDEGAGYKAGYGAEGGHGGVRGGGDFPRERFADDGEREDADDAESAKNRDHVGKRDAVGHGDVSDGNVQGHWHGKKCRDECDQKNAADGDLGNERLSGKKFDDECAEDGREEHQRKRETENVPEAFDVGESRAEQGLGPGFRNRDFDGAGNGGGFRSLKRSGGGSESQDQEKNGGEFD